MSTYGEHGSLKWQNSKGFLVRLPFLVMGICVYTMKYSLWLYLSVCLSVVSPSVLHLWG